MSAVDTLRRILTEIGWEPQETELAGSFFVDFGDPHVPVSTAFAGITEREQFVFYINLAPNAPEERRQEVAKFIVGVNWSLIVGSFDMDFGDGHVRFRASVDFRGDVLLESVIRNTILVAMRAVEANADAILDVALRGRSAAEALRTKIDAS